MNDLSARLVTVFGADRLRRDVPLAPLTTFKVGGPAEWFVETQTEAEMIAAIKAAHAAGMKVTILGG
ncbi:MAG TPA: hypothetical protein VF239_20860, partial [Vicinamibacterales bacterium]